MSTRDSHLGAYVRLRRSFGQDVARLLPRFVGDADTRGLEFVTIRAAVAGRLSLPPLSKCRCGHSQRRMLGPEAAARVGQRGTGI